jgi:Protein of unknown function (DUF3102)
MAEIQLRFDYGALDTETRRFVLERTERIHNLARMTAAGIVQIGQYLAEVKARLQHGKFLEWIEREFAWHRDTANNFMQVYECFKCRDFRQMEIDVSALCLIAKPSIPEPVRADVIRRAEAGEPVNHAGTRALVKRFAETGQLPEVTVSLPQLIAERRALMQPQPKQQPPSPEEEQRRAEEAELRAKMKVNSERVVKVFNVIGSIECLSGTPLTVTEIAAEIRRLDTPDKDWRGQLKIARQKLAELSTELSS